MDFEKLNSAVPEAQDQILAMRAYKREVEEFEGPRQELSERLENVMDFFEALYIEGLAAGRKLHIEGIVIKEVEATEKTESEPARPAGQVVLYIHPTIRGGNKSKSIKEHFRFGTKADDPAADARAFKLEYKFKPTDQDTDEKVNGREESICKESTRWGESSDDDQEQSEIAPNLWSHTIVELPKKSAYTGENKKFLRYFADTYFPRRQEQVTALEGSRDLIIAALMDPTLNPWNQKLSIANVAQSQDSEVELRTTKA